MCFAASPAHGPVQARGLTAMSMSPLARGAMSDMGGWEIQSGTFETEDDNSSPVRATKSSLVLVEETVEMLPKILFALFDNPQFFVAQHEHYVHRGEAEERFPSEGLYWLSIAVTNTINLLILVSTTAFCMETMDEYKGNRAWHYVELVCVTAFTTDLVIRVFGALYTKQFRTFCKDSMNWVDFMAIAPFYLQLFLDMPDLRFVRVIRLARILRALRNSRFAKMGAIVADIFNSSSAALAIPVYFMALAMIFFASMVYYAEHCNHYEDPDCVVNFEHIPHAMWWCVSTFTTVGYGDVSPIYPVSKLIGMVSMFAGIFFLAMPLSIIGASFNDAWAKLEHIRQTEEAHAKQVEEEWRVDEDDVRRVKIFVIEHIMRLQQLLLECAPGLQDLGASQKETSFWTANRKPASRWAAGCGALSAECTRCQSTG